MTTAAPIANSDRYLIMDVLRGFALFGVMMVGQMALTNYLVQSVAIILMLTGAGPDLGLAGKAGISIFLPLVIVFFTAQIVFSHFWMKAFAFGPAEWLWRTLTYRSAPKCSGTLIVAADGAG